MSILIQAGRRKPRTISLAPPGRRATGSARRVVGRGESLSRLEPLNLAFHADPDELAAVRRQLRNWLGQLSLDTVVAQDVLIAACEACANAIEHGYRGSRVGIVRVRLEVSGADLRVTVSDRGGWRPPRHVPDRGYGLKLIRATMRDVTITTDQMGTTVEMRASTP